jgi:hypothetical protein
MSHSRTTGLLMAPVLAGIILVVITSVFYEGGNARGQNEIGDVTSDGQQSSRSIRFFHDPKPEPNVPREALRAGTGEAQDKNYGALRNVIHGPIMAIKIRYFDSKAFDRARAESFVKAVLESQRGDTYTHIFWAEGLGVPEIEGYLYSENLAYPGYLLVWPGRAVYRDPNGKWWFTSLPQMEGKR